MSWVFAFLCAILCAWDIGGTQFLRGAGTFLKFQQVDSEGFARLDRQTEATAEIKEFFGPKLGVAGLYRGESRETGLSSCSPG